jgi:L-alanine-DL-glutamate epimerase-like enolase superfamily enzyme
MMANAGEGLGAVSEAQSLEAARIYNVRRAGMNIRRIGLFRVIVPLKKIVKHASHTRVESENLVVRVELASGQVGYGEGVPRSYVTGETVDSTFEILARHDWAGIIGRPADFADLVRRLESLVLPETETDPRGMAGNSARCALELALLDAYGRAFGQPVGRAIELAEVPGLRRHSSPRTVRYSAAITAESRRKELISAFKFRLYFFRDVKAKVGVAGQDDAVRLKWIRRVLGSRIDLRLDANEAWSASELVERVAPLRRFAISVLEQPLPHGEAHALAELRPRLGIPVMLDESLCGYPDAIRARNLGLADMFNVRLSKCGGIFPSLRIIGLAQRSGLALQLGCHPGETALLSAAGRHIASRVQGLSYVEGSYDRHILRTNLTRDDITFGHGGKARPLRGPGLGIDVDHAALEAMTTEQHDISYD